MEGNPCAKSEGFYGYVVTFLPQIKYYYYELITDLDREAFIPQYELV